MTFMPILRVRKAKHCSSASTSNPSSLATLAMYSLLMMMAIYSLFLLSSFLNVRFPKLRTVAMMVKMHLVSSSLK